MIFATLALVAALSDWTRVRPDPDLTPGGLTSLDATHVCATRWGLDRRHVTERMKRQVAGWYGVPWSRRASYEFDHLVPRELGGADVVENLWPQPRAGVWSAARKDRLENALHRKVCRGELTLDFAQQAILADWVAAYRLHVEDK